MGLSTCQPMRTEDRRTLTNHKPTNWDHKHPLSTSCVENSSLLMILIPPHLFLMIFLSEPSWQLRNNLTLRKITFKLCKLLLAGWRETKNKDLWWCKYYPQKPKIEDKMTIHCNFFGASIGDITFKRYQDTKSVLIVE